MGEHSQSGYDVLISDPHFISKHYSRIGNVPATSYHIFGRRAGFNSTSVLQDVGEWLGGTFDVFPELTGVENLEVVSSSASDTAAGTGTRTIRITYLDASNNMQISAPVTMNGVTAVALGFKAKFIYWMEVVTGGTSEVSAGNITLQIAGGGAVHEQISAGGNRSMSARFLCPAGFHAHVSQWEVGSVGSATQDARIRFTAFQDGTLSTRYLFKDNIFLGAASGFKQTTPWLVCPSLGKIKISTIASATGAANRIDATFSILLVANM